MDWAPAHFPSSLSLSHPVSPLQKAERAQREANNYKLLLASEKKKFQKLQNEHNEVLKQGGGGGVKGVEGDFEELKKKILELEAQLKKERQTAATLAAELEAISLSMGGKASGEQARKV